MAFDLVIPPKAQNLVAPAVASVKWRGKQLCCFVTLRRRLAESLGIAAAGGKVHVAVGSAADAGKIRVKADADGYFTPRTLRAGSLCVAFPVPAFLGDDLRKPTAARAEMVAGAVVVTLPWDASVPPARPAALAPETALITPEPGIALRRAPAQHYVAIWGMDFDPAPGKERVGRAGKWIEVSPRGFKLLRMLALAEGEPVSDAEIILRLWEVRPPGVTAMLDMVLRDLKTLRLVDFAVEPVRGKGFRLVDHANGKAAS
jgi:hypothetical protein